MMNTNINNEVNAVVRSNKVKDVLEGLHIEMANEKNHIFERFAYCCARYFYMWDQLDFYFKTYFNNEITKRYLDGNRSLLYKFIFFVLIFKIAVFINQNGVFVM